MATLWVWDTNGLSDVDFCKVRVFSKTDPELVMPVLFLTCIPARDVSVGETVYVRGWLQGGDGTAIRLDFGDGTIVQDYEPYSVVEHRYSTSGIHVLSGYALVNNRPVAQKLKIVVAEPRDRAAAGAAAAWRSDLGRMAGFRRSDPAVPARQACQVLCASLKSNFPSYSISVDFVVSASMIQVLQMDQKRTASLLRGALGW
jgi:hypothetical protein